MSLQSLFLVCVLITSTNAAIQQSKDDIAKDVHSMAKKLEELSKFGDINVNYKLIDDIAQAVHYWPFFKDHLSQPRNLQMAGYTLNHHFDELRSSYRHALYSLPCPLNQDFIRKSENTTMYWLTNAETLIFSMHNDSHQTAHNKCHFGHDQHVWNHHVKYMDTPENKKSLDIMDKRFCTEEQQKTLGPKVAEIEFTVSMLVMKICYEDHYKGTAEQKAKLRSRQTDAFREYFPNLKTAY